ncbi:AAA family ATPase [Muricoccus pecuniae]|nr:AAA family ATPase [Roseomonas pecuniae]
MGEDASEEDEQPQDAARAAARELIRRVLSEHGGVDTVRGRLLVVEAAQAWLDPVATVVGDEDALVLTADHKMLATEANRTVRNAQNALQRGRTVYVLTHDPSLVPPDVLSGADHRVVLGDVDARALSAAARAACNEEITISDEPPVGISPGMLRTAQRAGQGAQAYVARVLAVATAAQATASPGPGLDGLHGMDKAVAWGRALARDLRAYREGKLAWSAVDRGCVLSGPPGVGKTTFVKRLAAECGVPLIATSYGDWQSHGGGYLGDVIKALREAFRRARAQTPCILFIDELDSVQARGRGARHDDWWTAVINALLAELDGAVGREGVLAIGASNHVERIDPAIRRSGRLDREIAIQLPDTDALSRILRAYLGTSLDGVDLGPVAIRALGGSGADCERWVRGARRRARHEGREVSLGDLLAEIGGGEGSELPAAYRERVAIHEAGHVVAYAVLGIARVLSANLHAEGGLAGSVQIAQAEPTAIVPDEIRARLVACLAGRAAEEVLLGSVSGGSGGSEGSDLAEATHLAALAEFSLGLGTGLVWYGAVSRAEVGGVLLRRPDLAGQVEARVHEAYRGALDLLHEHRLAVTQVASALVTQGALDGEQLRKIVEATIREQEPSQAMC